MTTSASGDSPPALHSPCSSRHSLLPIRLCCNACCSPACLRYHDRQCCCCMLQLQGPEQAAGTGPLDLQLVTGIKEDSPARNTAAFWLSD